jgi:uncharacterized protein
MSREFPDWINPWAAAQGRREFNGTWPLAKMPRLAPLLCAAGGDAVFSLRLSTDMDQRPVIALRVEAELPLTCQASLQPYLQPVEREVELGVVASMAEVQLLPDHLDPVLVENGRVAVVTLVEDELLLAMPQVPRNPALDTVVVEAGDDAPATETAAGEPRQRPFAGLDELLSESSKRTSKR